MSTFDLKLAFMHAFLRQLNSQVAVATQVVPALVPPPYHGAAVSSIQEFVVWPEMRLLSD